MIKKLYTLFLIAFCYSAIGYGQTYEVIKVEFECKTSPLYNSINSPANEFSPYVVDQILYFSSDRDPDYLSGGGNNWEKSKSINLYQAELKGDINASSKVKNLRLVSERLFTGDHTGPAAFSEKGDTMFISQIVTDTKTGELYPQLFFAVKFKKRYSRLKALPFNNPSYSYGHPFYDSAKKRLYFASNKPGGMGGKDIYFSDLSKGVWSDPEPLKEVNTSADELFPYFSNNVFFYATNPNQKNKGLDIYWKLLDGKNNAQPLKGVNTNKDDFGIYIFPGMTKGYLSSNINGSDDLFYFDMNRTVTVKNEMAGNFTFKNIEGSPSQIKVQILDENDFLLYETTTDKDGNFVFNEIELGKNYVIKAVTDNELDLALKNKDGEYVVSLIDDEDNAFTYRKIGADLNGTLSLVPDDMIDFELNEGHLTGQLVYENDPDKFPTDLKVILVNKKTGKESYSTLTDENGNFDFKKIAMAEDYLLKIPEAEDDFLLMIYDLKGNIVAQLKSDKNGEFIYRKINPDFSNELELVQANEALFEFDSQTIWGYFEYDNNNTLNKKGLTVNAYSENGLLVAQELTNDNGVFRFKNLPPNKSLLFKLEENNENFILDEFTLYIYDRFGQKVAGLKRGQEGFFTFRPLGYDIGNELSKIEENNIDFILGDLVKTRGITVYFDSNKSQVKNSDLKIVKNIYTVLENNPNAKVEINAYADAKSSDEYNLILSQKRGDWIVAYLTKKGIAANRIIVNAYGEASLVDSANDALNRRAEIHLY